MKQLKPFFCLINQNESSQLIQIQEPSLNCAIPQTLASHLFEYVLLLHPQTGAYSLVQAISLLFLSCLHSLSFFTAKNRQSGKKKNNFFHFYFYCNSKAKTILLNFRPNYLERKCQQLIQPTNKEGIILL